ncbi:MAG: cell division protein FtsZ, partial [Cytophagales bacterium]|nr:cell division protein FtsZ [Cytophagales bacterium]
MIEGEDFEFINPTSSDSIITALGVGGGGSNAVNHMFQQGIRDVEFVICNTDLQALKSGSVERKLQIGKELTDGRGVGANPTKGRDAALESAEEIRNMLAKDTKMLFITAGLGGGTGTGASPEIAKIAREMDILTVGIVTLPFEFEGNQKMFRAQEGLKLLKENVDATLVILNERLFEFYGKLGLSEAFAKADDVLTKVAKGIAEMITVPGRINLDFEDVKTVMKDSGEVVMGIAEAYGEDRARRVVEDAINTPILSKNGLNGAKNILFQVMCGQTEPLQTDEIEKISAAIRTYTQYEHKEMIFGYTEDHPELGNKISLTIVGTGFTNKEGEPASLKVEKRVKKENKNNENKDKFSLFGKPTSIPIDKEVEIEELDGMATALRPKYHQNTQS